MVKHKLCRKCDEKFKNLERGSGDIELKFGHVEIDGPLCSDCYDELVYLIRNNE